jgi:hypothetical protein
VAVQLLNCQIQRERGDPIASASRFLPKTGYGCVVQIFLGLSLHSAISLARGGARRQRHPDLIRQIERESQLSRSGKLGV